MPSRARMSRSRESICSRALAASLESSWPRTCAVARSRASSTGRSRTTQSLGGTLEQLGLLAHRALAEVVEVGLQAPERVEVLVTLGRHEGLFGLGCQILLRLPRVGSPVRAAALSSRASSSRSDQLAGPSSSSARSSSWLAASSSPASGLAEPFASRPAQVAPLRLADGSRVACLAGHEAAVPGSSTISASTTSSSAGPLESPEPPEPSLRRSWPDRRRPAAGPPARRAAGRAPARRCGGCRCRAGSGRHRCLRATRAGSSSAPSTCSRSSAGTLSPWSFRSFSVW